MSDTPTPRMDAFNAARPDGYVIKPVNLTADEARAMIDGVLRSYGLDPALAMHASGWRELRLGTAVGLAGVIEWQTEEPYLVVFAPLRELPAELQVSELYRALLQANHTETLSARFSLDDDTLFVSLVRPIRGLDPDEVDAALRAVLLTADQADRWLDQALTVFLGAASMPLEELPRVRLKPEEMRSLTPLLLLAGPPQRAFMRALLEKWEKAGYPFDVTLSGINLRIPFGRRKYLLATVRSELRRAGLQMAVAWEALHWQAAFPPEALKKYHQALLALTPLQPMEGLAYFDLTDDLDAAAAAKLVKALDKLAKAVQHEQVSARPATDPHIAVTLEACDEHAKAIFQRLLDGWQAAGAAVKADKPGRIGLMVHAANKALRHPSAPEKFILTTLVAPKGRQPARLEVTWGLNQGDWPYLTGAPEAADAFRQAVFALPGAGLPLDAKKKTPAAYQFVVPIPLQDFQPEHADELLEAMKKLKEALGS